MTYQTTITRKGQITIPKEIRKILKLKEGKKLELEIEKEKRKVRIKPTRDFLEFAKKIKVKKKVDPVKVREYMEKFYVRI
ncbi:MAG: AbrB/MazE/SpoVT family DNA-binding domain-containing protein [Patescibacteria group bacterium]|nr:AbrB/MazE/SpoVT family DNA-binding domain-containing protein [Patescibacteria group bacterium]